MSKQNSASYANSKKSTKDVYKRQTTNSFKKASNQKAAPLTGVCNMRVGEDGRLYLLGKSEHYHTPLGHRFQGYKLIENAKKIGILNATHNNTRGYITRLMEREMVRTANGLNAGDTKALEPVSYTHLYAYVNREEQACPQGIKTIYIKEDIAAVLKLL